MQSPHGAGVSPLSGCLGLRVQTLDLTLREILARTGKGAKDRVTVLPEALDVPLKEHLKAVRRRHERDLADGWGRVVLPGALDQKYPNAPQEYRWQWEFPQEGRWENVAIRLNGG